jgi:hypothetical protein
MLMPSEQQQAVTASVVWLQPLPAAGTNAAVCLLHSSVKP